MVFFAVPDADFFNTKAHPIPNNRPRRASHGTPFLKMRCARAGPLGTLPPWSRRMRFHAGCGRGLHDVCAAAARGLDGVYAEKRIVKRTSCRAGAGTEQRQTG